MNKTHKIFLTQLAICFAVLLIAIYMINSAFLKASDSEDYLLDNENITNIRKLSVEIINNLIAEDALTFDPTNGSSIERIFKNLKVTNKRKILLLGSSQLVTVSGDKSFDKHKRRTDGLLQKMYDDEVVVYNLSMGSMTTAEKEIILTKIQELYDFDAVVISIGPYDCREDNIRQTIRDLKTKKFEPKEVNTKNEVQNTSVTSLISIENFNNSIEENINSLLEENISFYKNKSAIKKWLARKVTYVTSTEQALEKGLGEPNGWNTYQQKLDNKTGWVMVDGEKKSSKSLKIINTDKTNANWKGIKVNLKKPTKTIVFGASSKSENVKDAKLYCFDVKVDFVDGSYEMYYEGFKFKQGTNDWSSLEKKLTFKKEVVSITPIVLLYEGTGTVWFDNIYAKPVYGNEIGDNVLVNGQIDEEKINKDVKTMTFNEDLWTKIYKNSSELVTYFAKNTKSDVKKYILIPPVYNSIQINAYEQKIFLDKYITNLKKLCENNNIKLLDASKILNQNYYVESQFGNNKGLIDPLHFTGPGHKKLATYLYNKLEVNNVK